MSKHISCADTQKILIDAITADERSCADAIKVLSDAMKADDQVARNWHCNLAMMAQDAGASYRQANLRAANFMKNCFGVDVSHLIVFSQTKS